MPTVTSPDGTSIAHDRIGAGPLVVLVNGAMGYRENHSDRPLAERLAGSFTVITYDRRGRGESTDTAPYDVAREIDDIQVLIDSAGGPACLYGFSSGAALALRAAAALARSVRMLALCNPPFGPATEAGRAGFAAYAHEIDDLLRRGRPGDAAARFFADMLPAEAIEEMRRSPDWRTVEQVAPTIAYDNAVMGDGTVPHSLARAVTVPTLVFGSRIMPFTVDAAEALTRELQNAELEILEQPTPDVLTPPLTAFFGRTAPQAS